MTSPAPMAGPPRLTITRGLPGSGKTTVARAWIAEAPERRARVNRDDLRAMLHASVWLGEPTERQVRSVRDAAITTLLAGGTSVVCDDTNLDERTVRDLWALAGLAGADFEVADLRHVPVEVCVRRDAGRDRPVGGDVIRDLAARHLGAVDAAASDAPGPVDEPDGAGEAFAARLDDQMGAGR